MLRTSHRSRLPRFAVLILAGVGIAAALGTAANHLTPHRAEATLECRATMRLFLFELGIGPESLAAAGVTGQEAEGIAAFAMALCESPGNSFADVQSQLESARAEYLRLETAVRTGTATGEERTEFATARGNFLERLESRTDCLASLRTAVESRLDEGQKTRLRNVASARHVEVPMYYKVVQRSASEWTALRDQLSESDRMRRAGVEVQSAAPEQEVQDAKVRLESNLQSVMSGWSAAFGS
jgi:hypothetical protein